MIGHEVVSFENLNVGIFTVNTDQLTKGIYMVNVYKNGSIASKKFFKELAGKFLCKGCLLYEDSLLCLSQGCHPGCHLGCYLGCYLSYYPEVQFLPYSSI